MNTLSTGISRKPIQVKMGKEAKIGVEIKKALATTQFEVTGKGSCR